MDFAKILALFRQLLSSAEVITLIIVLGLSYVFLFSRLSFKCWTFLERLKVKLELRWGSNLGKQMSTWDQVLVNGVTWQLLRGNTGVFAIQGKRPYMEDRFNVVQDWEHTKTSIYGVFDGHGGEFAAEFTEKMIFKSIMIRLLKSALCHESPDYAALLTEEILTVDKQLLDVEQATMEISGTTVLLAMVTKGNKLVVANVGDSRGVLCDQNGSVVPLSYDHKPQLQRERSRIREAGGFISYNGVWRVSGVLATSRALGDYPLKEGNVLIAEPDVLIFDIDVLKPKFMILATDGLWDVFSNEEAVEFIKQSLDKPLYGARDLVKEAYSRGSLDNITVIVVNFESSPSSSVNELPDDGLADSLTG